jgi:SAM-dependent methyltransferase
MTCSLCGGQTTHWFATPIDPKKNMKSHFDEVVRCQSCGTGQLSPLPKAEDVPPFYELPQYYTHGEGHIARVAPTLADRALIKLAHLVDKGRIFDPSAVMAMLPPNASVCDLGCGPGVLLQQFKAAGCTVVGVDPDPEARALGERRGIEVVAGTGEDLPASFAGRTFDLVLMTHSLEHCINPAYALANVRRLVKDDGLFYCEVPNSDCAHFKTFLASSEMCDAPRHIYFFGPKSLETALEQAAFSKCETFYSGLTRHHLPGWRQWESTIYDRSLAIDPSFRSTKHSFAASASLLARTAFASPADQYDCVGILAKATAR